LVAAGSLKFSVVLVPAKFVSVVQLVKFVET
jgi:hypothetical protein